MAHFGRNVTPLSGRSKSCVLVSQCSADCVASSMLMSRFRRSDVQKCRSGLWSEDLQGQALLARGEAALEGGSRQPQARGLWGLEAAPRV